MVLSFIRSKPMKIDWDAVKRAVNRIVIEAMAIRYADSGLLKIVDAMKLAVKSDRTVRAIPVATLIVNPAMIVLRRSPSLFAALRLAQYFIKAALMPQS